MPESLEASVARAVAAAWEAMWIHDSQAGMTIVAPPTEAENPSLWRQVRAVVEVVTAAAPRADSTAEQTFEAVENAVSYYLTTRPHAEAGDLSARVIAERTLAAIANVVAARAPGRSVT